MSCIRSICPNTAVPTSVLAVGPYASGELSSLLLDYHHVLTYLCPIGLFLDPLPVPQVCPCLLHPSFLMLILCSVAVIHISVAFQHSKSLLTFSTSTLMLLLLHHVVLDSSMYAGGLL